MCWRTGFRCFGGFIWSITSISSLDGDSFPLRRDAVVGTVAPGADPAGRRVAHRDFGMANLTSDIDPVSHSNVSLPIGSSAGFS
jgi:hypothetical protein